MSKVEVQKGASAGWDQEQVQLNRSNTTPWTIEESLQGIHVFGDAGSGKTSGSGRVNGGSTYELVWTN